MDENIYDFYSRGIIGVIAHGHVVNIYIDVCNLHMTRGRKFCLEKVWSTARFSLPTGLELPNSRLPD